MSITPASPFRLGTQISEDEFERELRKKNALDSPLFNGYPDFAAKQQAARRMYRMIVAAGHSAEIFVGICGKEHTYGTNANSVLHRNDTRSWGNARTVRDPSLPKGTFRVEAGKQVKNMDGWYLVTDPIRASNYAQYMSVEDSVQDFIYRIDDPTYAYAGKTTIAEIVSTIAPKEDNNDPEGYAWFLVNVVIGLRSRMVDPHPGGDSALVPWIPADLKHYTPGRSVPWPEMIILHHTDGWDSLYWLTESPNSNVSATYLFNNDGTIRAQLVRHRDTPHTTGHMNPVSLSGEWERKWPQQTPVSDLQYANLSDSIAFIWTVEASRGNPNFSMPPTIEQINKHNDYFQTICPGNLDVDRLWREVRDILVETATGERVFKLPDGKEHPYTIRGRIRARWEDAERAGLAWVDYGYPVSSEYEYTHDGKKGVRQDFQRCSLFYDGSQKHPWDVTSIFVADLNDEAVTRAFDEAGIDPDNPPAEGVDRDTVQSSVDGLDAIAETLRDALKA